MYAINPDMGHEGRGSDGAEYDRDSEPLDQQSGRKPSPEEVTDFYRRMVRENSMKRQNDFRQTFGENITRHDIEEMRKRELKENMRWKVREKVEAIKGEVGIRLGIYGLPMLLCGAMGAGLGRYVDGRGIEYEPALNALTATGALFGATVGLGIGLYWAIGFMNDVSREQDKSIIRWREGMPPRHDDSDNDF